MQRGDPWQGNSPRGEQCHSVIYGSPAGVAKETVDSTWTVVHVNNTVYLSYTNKLSNRPCWHSSLKTNCRFLAFFCSDANTPLTGVCQTDHVLQN